MQTNVIILTEVCSQVIVEPELQPVNGNPDEYSFSLVFQPLKIWHQLLQMSGFPLSTENLSGLASLVFIESTDC